MLQLTMPMGKVCVAFLSNTATALVGVTIILALLLDILWCICGIGYILWRFYAYGNSC